MSDLNLEELTIILPAYGDSPYLFKSITSTVPLLKCGASLLLIDDGITDHARQTIVEFIQNHRFQRIKLVSNQQNLGLFESLNQNICHATTSWLCFLCSDDYFLPESSLILTRLLQNNEVDLILSAFKSVNQDLSERYNDCRDHSILIREFGHILTPNQMLISLLRFGSLNGNLSGVVIRTSLWHSVGPFRSTWRHAADWEWIVRAAERTLTLLNQEEIVSVRTHEEQLSHVNLKKWLNFT